MCIYTLCMCVCVYIFSGLQVPFTVTSYELDENQDKLSLFLHFKQDTITCFT